MGTTGNQGSACNLDYSDFFLLVTKTKIYKVLFILASLNLWLEHHKMLFLTSVQVK